MTLLGCSNFSDRRHQPPLFPEAPPSRDEVGPQSSLQGIINSAQAGDLVSEEVFKLVEFHEGRKNRVYKDSEGVLTIGVGFNLERPGARKDIEALGVNFDDLRSGRVSLSNDHIDQLLSQDLTNSRLSAASLFPDISTYSPARQAALVDMTFNLGPTRLRGFEEMRKAIKAGDWDKAADEAQDSKWFNQVGRRGPAIVNMLRNG